MLPCPSPALTRGHGAAMQFHQLLYQCQAQAQSAAVAVGASFPAREQAEQVGHPAGRNADAVIGDRDGQLCRRRAPWQYRCCRPRAYIARRCPGYCRPLAAAAYRSPETTLSPSVSARSTACRLSLIAPSSCSSASWITTRMSTGSRLRTMRPRDTREMSIRSSTRRLMCPTWPRNQFAQLRGAVMVEFLGFQHGRSHAGGRQRIAQFMGEDGEELVLADVGVAQGFAGDVDVGHIARHRHQRVEGAIGVAHWRHHDIPPARRAFRCRAECRELHALTAESPGDGIEHQWRAPPPATRRATFSADVANRAELERLHRAGIDLDDVAVRYR